MEERRAQFDSGSRLPLDAHLDVHGGNVVAGHELQSAEVAVQLRLDGSLVCFAELGEPQEVIEKAVVVQTGRVAGAADVEQSITAIEYGGAGTYSWKSRLLTGRTPMLTADDVKQFHRLGYCVTPVLFDAQQIEQIRNAIDRVYANDLDQGLSWPFIAPVVGDGPYSVSTALFSAHVNRTIRVTVGHEDLVSMAATLLGCDAVRLWQDQAIRKPGTGSVAVDDGNIGFHQDYSYWQDSSTTNMVSANIALQDVTSETGALRVFPGSHKLGLLGDYSGFFNTDLNALRKQLQSDYGLGEDVPLELKAGQATFHHSLTVHGSGPNTGVSPRLVLAPAYIPDGTFFRDEGQPPCPHSDFLGDDRRHGSPFTGERFPLLRGKTRRSTG